MKLFQNLRYFGKEFVATMKSKHVLIPVLGLLVVPLLYSGVYLVANWDPYSNVKHMPVAVVNEDKPVQYEGKEIAIGRELMQKLHDNDSVEFHFVGRAEAERGLAEHTYYLLIDIPQEMSQHATTILDPNPKPLELKYKENSSFNFLSGQISDKVVEKIKAETSQKVTETYVEQMFGAIAQLADGLGAASDGAGQLENGLKQLGTGIETFRNELNGQINSKTSQAGSMVDKLLDENKVKLENTINKEIEQAIASNKGPLVNKLHQEIDKQSGTYGTELRDKVHARIDEVIGENSGIAQEKLNQEIDRAFGQYGEQVRNQIHDEINAAYASHKDDVYKEIVTEVDNTVVKMEPVAHAMMHNVIDNEAGEIDASIRNSVHKWIDEKIDALFDKTIERMTDNQDQIKRQFDKLQADLAAMKADAKPEEADKWQAIQDQLDGLRGNVHAALKPEQIEKLKVKIKLDLNQLVDKELNAVNKKLLTKVHSEADKKFSAYYPTARAMARGIALSKAEELAPVLLGKAHNYADQIYSEKSEQVQAKAHEVLNEKWSQLEPQVINEVHQHADDEINRVEPVVVSKIHETAEEKVNTLEPIVRDSMHKLANMKLDEAAKKVHQMAFEKMSALLHDVDTANKAINTGFNQLMDGQQQLISGGAELRSKLRDGAEKATQDSTDSTYHMISAPVTSDKEENHDVNTYGIGMAPYFLSLGFFVGALMFSIVFPMKETILRPPNGFAWLLSKFGTMTIESIFQVLIAGSVVLYGIGLTVTNVPMFFLVSLVTSLMFFAFIQFFVTAFGNVGRFIIIILLVLQLSATAGTFPIELTPEFFQMLHPWLPMTYTIRAYRGVVSLGDMNYVWQNIGVLCIYLFSSLFCSWMYFALCSKKSKRQEKDSTSGSVISAK
ncbi:YhgE/Pip domain-containing protein [Paenibacillus sp. ACRRX]|uniref:YhgE/Pip domain-containing protein n=1 Tax=Paenibacillus sp. ACRRX TaxID=2918206 RepID=UPI001EF6ED67|nr:YhgE/Pip domain-containing protein [Paenibacillus sp. ACRRX]MCG7405844.1 YhgE/Pip domain-containing protein [Paenibacillus sp. ACRRX]